MTATIAMTIDLNEDAPKPRTGLAARLLGRIKSTSQSLQTIAHSDVNLENTTLALQKLGQGVQTIGRFLQKKSIDTFNAVRNSSTEDKAWFLANVGMGFGAKALLLSGVATGGTSLLVAAAGGVITGTTRTLIDRARAHRDGDTAKLSQSFSHQLLRNTLTGGVISTATFGLLGGLNSLTGINLGETFARVAGKGLDNAKHAFMAAIPASEAATLPRATLPRGDSPATLLNQRVAAPVAASDEIISKKPMAQASTAAFAQELQARQAKIDSLTLEHLRGLIEKTTGVKPSPDLTAFELAQQFYPKHPQALLTTIQKNIQIPVVDTRSLSPSLSVPATASATAPAMAEKAMAPPIAQPTPVTSKIEVKVADGSIRNVQMPPRPDIKAEWKLALTKVQGMEIERLVRADYQAQFGTSAPDDLSPAEIAKLINPANSGQYIDEITQKAETVATETLPQDKMRGACLSDLPASEESHQSRGRVLPNICSIDTDAPIEEGEYITMRDVGEPVAKPEKRGVWSGIRAIFAGAKTPAPEFMSEAIGKVEISQMAADKLAISMR